MDGVSEIRLQGFQVYKQMLKSLFECPGRFYDRCDDAIATLNSGKHGGNMGMSRSNYLCIM